MAKNKRKQKTRRWVLRQQTDPYVKRARDEGFRARAVYKLAQADKKYHLLRPGQVVADLGSAPGSWAQYAAAKVGSSGLLLAVDMLAMSAVENTHFIQGDFTNPMVRAQIKNHLNGRLVDLVLSDMAPNITGIRITDHANAENIAVKVLDFCQESMQLDGSLLIKLFAGESVLVIKEIAGQLFKDMHIIKPIASRNESREVYLVARRFSYHR